MSQRRCEMSARVVSLGRDEPPYRLDLMTAISGMAFGDARESRLAGTLFGVPVLFLGREAFTRNKRASGRPRVLDDLRSLGA